MSTLADLRQKKKLTQAELAVELGVSQRAVAAYEGGERKPSPRVAERIRSVFDLTYSELWQMLYSEKDER